MEAEIAILAGEFNQMMHVIWLAFHIIAAAYATLILTWSGLVYMKTKEESEFSLAIRRIVIGLLVIYQAPTLVYFITRLYEIMPTFGQ